MTRTQSGLVAINLAALIFGCAALFGKLDVSPVWIVAMRGLFAALTLLPIAMARKVDFKVKGRGLLLPLVATGVLLALHWVSFFVSVQLAGIAVSTLTFATFPLFTVIVMAFRSSRRPSALQLAAGVVIVIAVALLVDVKDMGHAGRGVLAGLCAAVTYAFFSIHSKSLIEKMSPVAVSLVQNGIVFLSLAPVLPFAYPAPALLTDWLWLAVLGVVSTALMLQLFLFALARLPATVCSGFVALEPVYAIAFAALLFHEPLTVWVLLSGGMIFAASFALLAAETRSAA